MTVAVMVKVFDGVVLAADSAATLRLPNGDAQVWTNANKVFQLHKGLPLGAMTWGEGQLAGASISSHAKELRRRLTGTDGANPDWELDADDYTIEAVADRLAEFIGPMFDNEESFRGGNPPGPLGFLVAGYSSGSHRAEARRIEFRHQESPQVWEFAGEDDFGWAAFAQPSATERLFNGIEDQLVDDLAGDLAPVRIDILKQKYLRQPAVPAMPFADTLDLARFLVDVTIGYTRFVPGSDTVGGPVDIAAITDHEGFKWVERKHYYTRKLNREDQQL